MHINICKHHGLPYLNGYFCKKCQEDLAKSKKALDKLFSSPKVVKAINEVLTK